MFYDYAESGSWTQSTFRRNAEVFSEIQLRQRVAKDISQRSIEGQMLGETWAMPLALAPTGLTGMQHANGEILAAQAAEAFGVPFTLSTMSICSIEDVAANTQKPFWFQLYVMKDREFISALIQRARAANCSALVLTLDLQIIGQRHKEHERVECRSLLQKVGVQMGGAEDGHDQVRAPCYRDDKEEDQER